MAHVYHDSQLLNPGLYRALRQAYGDVRVNRPGVIARPRYRNVYNRFGELVPEVYYSQSSDRGEEFVLNCPRCGDRERKLTINYRWNVKDPQTGANRLGLINCYHHNCFAEFDQQNALSIELFGWQAGTRETQYLEEAAPSDLPLEPLQPIELKAMLQPFSWLRANLPQHQALTYLDSRGISPEWLEAAWGVSFCANCYDYSMLNDRIFIPIYLDGRLYGFQGRLCTDKKQPGKPKYWNMPNFPKERLLYNTNQASQFPLVVFCEGVSDIWCVGPPGVAVFGNRIHELQVKSIYERNPHPDWHALLLLDPTQDAKSLQRGEPHHMVVAEQVMSGLLGRHRVHTVWLPQHQDAGLFVGRTGRRVLWNLIVEGLRNGEQPYPGDLDSLAEQVCGGYSPLLKLSV